MDTYRAEDSRRLFSAGQDSGRRRRRIHNRFQLQSQSQGFISAFHNRTFCILPEGKADLHGETKYEVKSVFLQLATYLGTCSSVTQLYEDQSKD